MNQLKDAFDDLAGPAPGRTPASAPDLWRLGVRRRNRRRAAAVAASLALLAGVGLTAVALQGPATEAPVVDTPDPADLRLPQKIYRPSGWLPGTDEVGPPGRIAAVWWEMSGRTGWTGSRDGWMTVSAVDGSYRWLDVEVDAIQIGPPPVAVSPDGRYLAWADSSGAPVEAQEQAQSGGEVVVSFSDGFSVYDAETGQVRRLDLGESAPYGMVATPPTWSADSEHLVFQQCSAAAPGAVPSTARCARQPWSVWPVRGGDALPYAGTEGMKVVGRTTAGLLVQGPDRAPAGVDPETLSVPVGTTAELITRGGGIVVRPLAPVDLSSVEPLVGAFRDGRSTATWALGRRDTGEVITALAPGDGSAARVEPQPQAVGQARFPTSVVGARRLGNQPMLVMVVEGGDGGSEVEAVGVGRRANGSVVTSVGPFTGSFLQVPWDLVSVGEWESDPTPPPTPLDPRLPAGAAALAIALAAAVVLRFRRRGRA